MLALWGLPQAPELAQWCIGGPLRENTEKRFEHQLIFNSYQVHKLFLCDFDVIVDFVVKVMLQHEFCCSIVVLYFFRCIYI